VISVKHHPYGGLARRLASITGGCFASAGAIAMRCCSPPENGDTAARARCATSGACRSSSARCRAEVFELPASVGSAATLPVASRKEIR
jgi:hypothetical protein